MGKFSNTWSLMGASWEVLKKDKELLTFPLISGFCCLLLTASFAVPLFSSGSWMVKGGHASTGQQAAYYAVLFIFYFLNYFIIAFFNSAVVACAAIRMQGGDPTVSDGLRAAAERLLLIIGWAFISATVGLILRIIEERAKGIARLFAGLLGTAWTLASFLVVPIMVIDEKDPVTALKDSSALFKKMWGEEIIGNFSFGLVFAVLGIPAFILILMGMLAGSPVTLIFFLVLAVLYIIILSLVQSALQAIFQTALYLYARDGNAPPGFSQELLNDSLTQR